MFVFLISEINKLTGYNDEVLIIKVMVVINAISYMKNIGLVFFSCSNIT